MENNFLSIPVASKYEIEQIKVINGGKSDNVQYIPVISQYIIFNVYCIEQIAENVWGYATIWVRGEHYYTGVTLEDLNHILHTQSLL